MYRGDVCRLCVDICEDYKSLYDESDNANEVHQLMIQYFDQKLLTGNNFNVMCMKCWHQISDFNNFQQSVYQAQKILHIKEEEIDIKLEEEFLPEENIASSYNEQSNDSNNFAWELFRSSSADSLKTEDKMEYDDRVDVYIDGEFGSGDNSRELTVSAALSADCYEPLKTNERPRLAVKVSDDLIAQWTPVLECIYCIEKSATYSLLKSHFKKKHPSLKCQVQCCGEFYSQRESYEDHIRLHIDSNPVTCTLCGTQLDNQSALTLHIRVHHPTSVDAALNPGLDSNILLAENVPDASVDIWNLSRNKYIKESDDFIAKMKPNLKCDLCPLRYSTYSLLQQHFLEKHPKNKCYVMCCQNKFSSRCYFADHLEIHANPDAYKCELCTMRYSSRYRLRAHLRKHHSTGTNHTKIRRKRNPSTSNNTYEKSDKLLAKWLPNVECSVCMKVYTTLTLLQCHFLECHPNEDFHIECCQRKLRNRSEIECHVRYHVDPTGFKCDLCCIRYDHSPSLRHHMLAYHDSKNRYVPEKNCDI